MISRFCMAIAATALLLTATVRGYAQEVYFDQFDWGSPTDLNTAFWSGGASNASYQPDLPVAALEGALSLGGGGGYSNTDTISLASAFPTLDYQFYVHARMANFPNGTGEENAEFAFRSNGSEGYLLTLDGGQDQIRLRRQGSGYADLVAPTPLAIAPGDDFYLSVIVRGTNPTLIDATVSRTPDLAAPVFKVAHSESDWQPTGDKVELIGYVPSGAYRFDIDYFAIGQPGFSHPLSAWSRTGHTGAAAEPPSRKIGNLTSYDVSESGVVLHSGANTVALVPRLDRTIRVDFLPEGVAAMPASWAVTRTDWPAAPFTVTDGDPIRIESDGWRVDVSRAPMRLTYRRPDGTEILREAEDLPLMASGASRRAGFVLDPGESIYGLGEHSAGSSTSLDRHGRLFRIDNDHQPPSYLIFPYWTSTRNCGVFIDNPGIATIDFGAATPGRVVYNSQAGEIGYYVIFGESMYDVQDQYTQLTGRAPVAPRWTLGNMQSRFGYGSFAEMQSIVDGFRTRNIPLESLVLDLYWFGQTTMVNLDFQNTAEWANPQAGIAALQARNVKVIPITEPQISSLSYNVGEVTSRKLVGLTISGSPMPGTGLSWITSAAVYLLDFTNPAAREWWIGKHEKLIKTYNFDGFWQDLNEQEGMPSDMQFAAGSATAVHNVQAIAMNRALDEAIALYRPGARTFIMSRSGYAGMQKYGASVWSGDVSSSWSHLAAQPGVALGMSMAGVPYWNSDIGGFNGTPSAELYIRWCQFGLFCPVYRPHGSHSEREPWVFGTQSENAVRDLLNLRSRLVPYYYTVARQTFDTGAPIMRPLVLEWPDDPVARTLDNQFLYGPSLMAAPVLARGATTRDVYLPDGVWYDWFTNEKLVGGLTVTRSTPLTSYPLLVRAPAIVPLGPELQTIQGAVLTKPTLRLYLPNESNTATGELYEDDGDTLDYQSGKFLRTTFTAQRAGLASVGITIAPSGAGYAALPASRSWRIEWIDADEPVAIAADGATLAHAASEAALEALPSGWSHDAATGRAVIKILSAPTIQPREIVVNLGGPPLSDRWEVY